MYKNLKNRRGSVSHSISFQRLSVSLKSIKRRKETEKMQTAKQMSKDIKTKLT